MSDSPKQKPEKRKLPPRPRIQLPTPGQYTPRPYPHTPSSYVGSSYGQTSIPMTPMTGQQTAVVYTDRANEFFTHLKGIKNWTKSGLSVGEKSAFWLYEKVSSWSKRWFTHIFLFFVLFLYSILGAFLFMYVERTNERIVMEDIISERDKVIRQMKDLWFEPSMINNSEMWVGQAKGQLIAYEKKLDQFLKQLRYQFDPSDDTWNIWNAIIYCCTVYTTIADDEEVVESPSMDEEEERRARMERMVEDTERLEERRSRTRSPAVSRRDTASPRRQEEAATATAAAPARSKRDDNDNGLRRRMGSPEGQRSRHLSPSSSADDDRLKRRSSSRHRYDDEHEQQQSAPAAAPRRSPSQPAKKQIIPLSDDSLYEDVARAKRAYSHREPSDDYEYEEYEEEEVRRNPRRTIRKRKTSIVHTDEERDEISKSVNGGSSWYSWIPFFGAKKQKVDELIEENDREKKETKAKLEKSNSVVAEPPQPPGRFRQFFSSMTDLSAEFREFCRQNPEEVRILIELRNLCIVEAIITLVLVGLGGLAFRFTEGAFETFYKCGVKRVKRDFLDSLWNYSHNMKEDDWKSMARRKLMEFEEQLHEAHEAGVQTYSGQKNWTFLNACVYCFTVITSIGYGHIYPNTKTGRALTIVYAIFGIPMFLIVLADFGKMFTRGIKFLWAFVRRLYYTGSCRQMRRTVPMQGMMKGVQAVYDFATFRRPSQMTPEEIVELQRQQQQLQQQASLSVDNNLQQIPSESPSTPAMSTFEIDDEFNLPISVAITILVFYIFIGATAFNIIEDWGFFDSFYFVFISMSTIGFGDFVPTEPLWMMLSIVYLIFGLALTSMCINVVQVMLTDQFKHASQKIGATIGFEVSEEDGSLKPSPPDPVEVAEVHNGTSNAKNGEKTKEKIAPKAKLEVDEL